MANNNKHTGPNVPALRFPEFSGEWKTFQLSDLAAYSKERVKMEILSSDNYVSTENMQQDFAGIKDAISLPSSGTAVEFQVGDILISNIRPYLKKIWLSDRNGGCSTDVLALRAKNEKVDSSFLYCRLANDDFVSYAMSGAKGVKMPRGDKQHILSYNLGVPSVQEQRRIAKLVSLLEKRISAQSKIIEELKTLRGALNESLYCCCESYQELSFNDVGVSYSGLSGKAGNDFGSGYPFIPYTNIFTNNIIDEGQLEYVQVREDESQNSVCFGDLLMTLSSETPEEVGIGAVYLGHESPLYLNSFAFGIHITRTDLVYPPYLSWLVSTNSFRKFILPYAQGSTRYNLQKTEFMKAKYRFPTLERQKAISVLLSGYSSKIENEERVLNKYTALKQGLIEQLFI